LNNLSDVDWDNSTDYQALWAECLEYVKDKIPNHTYETWFQPIKAASMTNKELFLQVPNKFFYDWIESHYKELLRQALKTITGNGIDINYSVMLSDTTHHQNDKSKPAVLSQNTISQPIAKVTNKEPRSGSGFLERGTKININYTFDNFIEGQNNQFAKAAAVAVANSPGQTSFSPLVIYGGTGLGKTHLLQAIGNEAMALGKAKRIAYVSSDTFTLDFITAIQNNKSTDFSKYYRSVDMLLMDDIQFFQGKESTQEQFFHIFNDLYQHHSQIVLTTDRPPMELQGLQDRMLSRFQAGLTVDIQPPDLETRIAILQKKAEHGNLDIPYKVLEYLATNIRSNIRELEGAMIRLLAYSSLSQVDIDISLTQKILRELGTGKPTLSISIEDIQKQVGKVYDINLDLMVGKSRKKEIAEARMTAMYFARELTNLSLKNIGLYFGGRDHSTVVHACKWVESRTEKDEQFKRYIYNVRQKIESKG